VPQEAEATAADTVVITGVGAVSGFGWSRRELWDGLQAGRTAIGSFDRFDHRHHRTHVAAQAPDPPTDNRGHRRLSWSDRFAVASAQEAVQHADLGALPASTRTGVYWGCSTGGMYEVERLMTEMAARPGRRQRVSPLASSTNDGPSSAVARHLRVRGPVETISAACASGTMAVGMGLQAVRRGDVDVAFAGGADSLCELTYAGFNALRAVDPEPCRPFRAGRAGMSLGEGAGTLVLESLEHARARGARPLAVVAGFGTSCDAGHMTAPRPDGEGAAHAIRLALADAGLDASAVDVINAHATGTEHNDPAEWNAFRKVFGERAQQIPLVCSKSMFGHLLGAAGALEAVVCVLTLLEQEAHPAPEGGEPEPAAPADLVQGSRRPLSGARTVLSTNLGFGGANAALIVARWSEEPA
jgi:3-oxoacyl-[acyl-carrier-protein] synthase II